MEKSSEANALEVFFVEVMGEKTAVIIDLLVDTIDEEALPEGLTAVLYEDRDGDGCGQRMRLASADRLR